jgi:hypothetical protein
MKTLTPLAAVLLIGCATTLVPGNPVEFELAVGETATLQDQDVSVQFKSVAADSRCPSDVSCVWAGDAELVLRLTGVSGVDDTTLHTTLDPRTLSRGSTTLEVLGLSPTPVSTTSTDPKSYRLRLRVSSAAASP